MKIFFEGKRALVTGAAGGIGKAITGQLLESGAHVIALDMAIENLEKLKQKYPAVEILVADLSDWNETREKVKSLLPINFLVNNAGILHMNEFFNFSLADFDSTMAVNIKAYFNLSQVVAANLIKRGVPGAIVNISSTASRLGRSHLSLYCASKGAVDAFTRALAQELGEKNIRVNAINPTFVRTGMTDCYGEGHVEKHLFQRQAIKRIAETEDIANAVVFLLSDKAKMITGVTLPVDGGFTAS